MVVRIEARFPGLRTSSFRVTSPTTRDYNCIAWAAFAKFGYAPASSEEPEPGFEKVALFASDSEPPPAARQLPSGRWTSKLGLREDIEHDLHAVTGEAYGTVVLLLK
jgi:hypothetical protein